MTSQTPAWNASAAPWSIALEEDVLLLWPQGWAAASAVVDAIAALPPDVDAHAGAGDHPAVLRLATSPRTRVAGAGAELGALRRRIDGALRPLGLAAGVAGTHPFTRGRGPTAALRVHVAVPDADGAAQALDGLRRQIPVLLALAGNSPYRRGQDTGFASSRVALLSRRPRTGIPPAFGCYRAYARTTVALAVATGRPPAACVCWDARLHPALGALEVTVLDAQTSLDNATALAALVQCLVRMHADRRAAASPALPPRTLEENRLLAARDGLGALLVDDLSDTRRPVRAMLDRIVEACLPAADALGCVAEVLDAERPAAAPGAERQRRFVSARRAPDASALRALAASLHDGFAPSAEPQDDRWLAA